MEPVQALQALGLITSIAIGYSLLSSIFRGFRTYILSRLYWPYRNLRSEYGGSWAVVTGPTRGIGHAYAMALAKSGFNIALIGRDKNRLAEIRDEIKSKFGVDSLFVNVDFLEDSPRLLITKLNELAETIDVGILVNNVGWLNTKGPIYVWETEAEDQMWPASVINCYGVSAVTRIFLPRMISRKKGAIINIASLAGVKPLLMNAVYAASKSFVDSFSRALEYEVGVAGLQGITIQTLVPSFIFTDTLHEHFKKASIMTPTAETFVWWALPTLGFNSRTAGYPVHDFQFFQVGLFGDWGHRLYTTLLETSWRKQVEREKQKKAN